MYDTPARHCKANGQVSVVGQMFKVLCQLNCQGPSAVFLKTLSWKLETWIMLKPPSWTSHSQLALTDIPLLWCNFFLFSQCKLNWWKIHWLDITCYAYWIEHEYPCPFACPQISSKYSVFLERPSHMSAIHPLTIRCICLLSSINIKVFSRGSVVRVFGRMYLEIKKKRKCK